MDTLNIWRALRRNRWLVLPVLIITLAGAGWALFVRPATYQVRSSVLLVPPPPAPTEAELDQHPRLRKLNYDNPYGRNYDPTVLIALVSIPITSPAGRAEIEKAGGDERFTVAQTTRYGVNSPFADITSSGSSAEAAIASNLLVIKTFERELARLQQKEEVSPGYLITARVAGEPATALVRTTDVGKLLLAIIGTGTLGIFAVVSIGDAVRQTRTSASTSRPPSRPPKPST